MLSVISVLKSKAVPFDVYQPSNLYFSSSVSALVGFVSGALTLSPSRTFLVAKAATAPLSESKVTVNHCFVIQPA